VAGGRAGAGGCVAGAAFNRVSTDRVRAFRKGIGETGFVEGRNVTVEYHWLEGHYDRLPALMAALVRHSLPRCKKRLGQGQTYSPDRDRLSIHP